LGEKARAQSKQHSILAGGTKPRRGLLSALRSVLYASLEDSEELEEVISGKKVGNLDERILEDAGDDAVFRNRSARKTPRRSIGAYLANSLYFPQSLVWKEAFENVRAVQRRNGEQVEQT